MYSSFLISGLVDLASLRIKLPRHASQVLLAVAFLVEATLFHFHTPAGSVTFSDQLHSMLALIVFGCAVFSALRIWMPVNLLVNIGLTFLIIFQDTWLIQVGTLLHGEGKAGEHAARHVGAMVSKDDGSHNAAMFAVACYSWHILAIALFVLATRLLVGKVRVCRYRRSREEAAAEEEGVPLNTMSMA